MVDCQWGRHGFLGRQEPLDDGFHFRVSSLGEVYCIHSLTSFARRYSIHAVSLLIICVILKVGVIPSLYDPSSGLRGVYLVASLIGGIIGGILCIVFNTAGSFLTAGLGGLAFGLFVQATRSGGLIRTMGFRFFLYFGAFAVGFGLYCVPRMQGTVMIVATALVGATAMVLGIDCFSTGECARFPLSHGISSDTVPSAPPAANLKEFYIRNIGLDELFVRKYPEVFGNNAWPLTTGQQIELGAIGAIFIMAVAFQWRLWEDIRRKIFIMRESDVDRENRRKADKAAKSIFRTVKHDLKEWEERYKNRSSNQNAGRDPGVDMVEGKRDERDFSLLNYIPHAPHTPDSFRSQTPTMDLEKAESWHDAISTSQSRNATARSNSFMNYLSVGRPREPAVTSQPDVAHQRTNSNATLPPVDLGSSISLSGHSDSSSVHRIPRKPSPSPGPDDHEALLDEIARIRRSIRDLQQSTSVDLESAVDPEASLRALRYEQVSKTHGGALQRADGRNQERSRYGSISSLKAGPMPRCTALMPFVVMLLPVLTRLHRCLPGLGLSPLYQLQSTSLLPPVDLVVGPSLQLRKPLLVPSLVLRKCHGAGAVSLVHAHTDAQTGCRKGTRQRRKRRSWRWRERGHRHHHWR